MKRLNQQRLDADAYQFALRRMVAQLEPKETADICSWAEHNIDLAALPVIAEPGMLQLRPYQREPLAATEAEGCQEVTLMFGQRLGKSTLWQIATCYRAAKGGMAGLIVYPSLDLGRRMNQDYLRPMLGLLPGASEDLASRGKVKRDSYHLPSLSSTIYFVGGGAPVISLAANFAVLDECDFVNLVNEAPDKQNVSQLRAVRLRMQTFKRRMLIAASSPSIKSGPIYRNWLLGSQGTWHNRCLGCGVLHSASRLSWRLEDGTYAGLQWEKDARGQVDESSIRWICPTCRRAHTEDEAMAMVEAGEFVHARPSMAAHRSFQVGAMASPQTWKWREIAEAQEAATDSDGKKFLCNSVLGTVYEHQRENSEDAEELGTALQSHMAEYPQDLPSRLSVVTMGVDQQKSELAGDKYFVWVRRGWDEDGNSWLLGSGAETSIDALRAKLQEPTGSLRPALALIDQGGFESDAELDAVVRDLPFASYYKGTDARFLQGRTWLPSKEQHKLYLAAALHWQVKLLELLYDPPRPVGYRWCMPIDPPQEYLAQVSAVRPNNRMSKNGSGDLYANWCARGRDRRDYFDAEKMALAALDIACHYLPPQSFPLHRKPAFWVREKLLAASRAAKSAGMR